MHSKDTQSSFLDSDLGFLLKVFLTSAIAALGIKVLGPLLPLPPTPALAIILVLLPTLGMGMVLLGRAKFQGR